MKEAYFAECNYTKRIHMNKFHNNFETLTRETVTSLSNESTKHFGNSIYLPPTQRGIEYQSPGFQVE